MDLFDFNRLKQTERRAGSECVYHMCGDDDGNSRWTRAPLWTGGMTDGMSEL